jgi:hypothetical protein
MTAVLVGIGATGIYGTVPVPAQRSREPADGTVKVQYDYTVDWIKFLVQSENIVKGHKFCNKERQQNGGGTRYLNTTSTEYS